MWQGTLPLRRIMEVEPLSVGKATVPLDKRRTQGKSKHSSKPLARAHHR
jgi:hypothetical protein